MPSFVDEEKFFDPNIKKLVQRISVSKAESVVSKILIKKKNNANQDLKASAVLGCDSLFEFDGRAFGKPRNAKEAIERWEMMSSRSGIIHTGHCLIYQKTINCREKVFTGMISDVISTKINFSKLSHIEIIKYVDTQEPMNCAGGFSIEGKGGAFIESIEGCYSNVVGLSLPWLRKALEKTYIKM